MSGGSSLLSSILSHVLGGRSGTFMTAISFVILLVRTRIRLTLFRSCVAVSADLVGFVCWLLVEVAFLD